MARTPGGGPKSALVLFSKSNRRVVRIALRVPVILLVLSAIAIPMEWRPWGSVPLDFNFEIPHFVVNIVGFVPVGIVLGELSLLREAVIAALFSIFAEIGQFVMMYRDCRSLVINGHPSANACAIESV